MESHSVIPDPGLAFGTLFNIPLGHWDPQVFWRINMDVVGGKIRVTKTVSLWLNLKPEYVQHAEVSHVRLVDATFVIKHRKINRVQANNGYVEFQGGCLECDDYGLNAQIIEIGNAVRVSKPFFRKVIANGFKDRGGLRIEAEVELQAGRRHDLFYYPQPNGEYVALWEENGGQQRNLKFNVNNLTSGPSPYFGTADNHQLRVRQINDAAVFQRKVDSKEMDVTTLTKDPFKPDFSLDPVTFYIGYVPDDPTAPDPGEQNANLLYGRIKSLEFDPNDLCEGCS
ncbi:MAG: hypothetical protein KDE09_18825 [Anaerolineales bacterium]|nr:hypothetical protein [Anaerolineales bacterium]